MPEATKPHRRFTASLGIATFACVIRHQTATLGPFGTSSMDILIPSIGSLRSQMIH
jgi:hypothetical protein